MPALPIRGRTPLALLFFVSGASGLLHEITWARTLSQSLGNSLQSQSAVLAAFLGGLGLGAGIGARRARTSHSPLRDYAALETSLGLFGLASPLLAALPLMALEALGPAFPSGLPIAGLRLALAVGLLLPATLAMGATFPLIVREAVPAGTEPRHAVALLYGCNTLGAACGALAGSFLTLPLLGTRGTFLAAGGINLAVGAFAFRLAPRGQERRPEAARIGPESAPLSGSAGLALAAACLVGLAGALMQIGWTRVAVLSFGSSVYALGFTLAIYVLGLGAGPLLLRRHLDRPGAEAAVTAAMAQATVAASSLLLLPIFGSLPLLAALLSSGLGAQPALMLALQFLILLVLLILPALAQGASLPPLIALGGGTRGAEAAGPVYAASSLGAVAGFVLGGFVALPWLGTQRTLAAASLMALTVSLGLIVISSRRRGALSAAGRPSARAVVAGALLSATLLGAAVLPRWDPILMSGGGFLYGPIYRAASRHVGVREAMRGRGAILYEKDGGEGLVTVRRSPTGVLSLQINGKTEASTGGDMGTQLLAGHLPLLLKADARTVLVIGLASGLTLEAAERHPVARLDVVEITPAVVGAARLFAGENGSALDDPRVRLVIDDARGRLLARADRYDVITSQPSNPWVAGVANLFTREFYRLVRSRLRPGGLFCQWLQTYRFTPDDLRGIVRAFLDVFPDATLWEESAGGGDAFLLGAEQPLTVDPAELARPGSAAAWADLRRAGVDSPADLLARYVSGPKGLRRFAGNRTPLTDDNLYVEWSAPLALFRETLLDQARAIAPFRESPFALLPADVASRAPLLASALSARVRSRSERLSILEGLRDADVWALGDPALVAGIEALRAGLYTEAARILSRSAAEPGAGATPSLLLAEAYQALGLEAAALVAFRQAVARDPDLAPAWNGLGRALVGQGENEAARVAFERALVEDPRLAAARNNLGAVLLKLGRLPEAEDALRETLASDPGLAPARANLGLVLKRRGDLAAAEQAYRAALDLDPLDTDVRFNLAELLRSTGRAEEARRQLNELLRVDPGDRLAARALNRSGS